MSVVHLEDLKPAGIAVAERFAAVVEGHRRTLVEEVLDPDGVEELMAAGLLVRDHRSEGLAPTVSLTDAGVVAVARYWLTDPAGPD
jgi:hypothetical protein